MGTTSIIVLVYNRPELTKQCLDSLYASLSDSKQFYEVIICDNGSNKQTAALVNSYEDFKYTKVVNCTPNKGVGGGKNYALKFAKGDFIYISDNDMCFEKGWLDTLQEAHEKFPGVTLLGAFRHPHHGVKETLHAIDTDLRVELSDTLVGSAWFMTKQTWQKYGPLLEGQSYGSDDTDFCNRLIADGNLVGSILPHKVKHCGATNTDGIPAAGAELIRQQEGVLVA